MAKRKSTISSLLGLMNTKHFGSKRRARHKEAQKRFFYKKKNPGSKYF